MEDPTFISVGYRETGIVSVNKQFFIYWRSIYISKIHNPNLSILIKCAISTLCDIHKNIIPCEKYKS